MVNNQTHLNLSWDLHILFTSPWTSQLPIPVFKLLFNQTPTMYMNYLTLFSCFPYEVHIIITFHNCKLSSERVSNSYKFTLLPSRSWDLNQICKILKPKQLFLISLWHFPLIKNKTKQTNKMVPIFPSLLFKIKSFL